MRVTWLRRFDFGEVEEEAEEERGLDSDCARVLMMLRGVGGWREGGREGGREGERDVRRTERGRR